MYRNIRTLYTCVVGEVKRVIYYATLLRRSTCILVVIHSSAKRRRKRDKISMIKCGVTCRKSVYLFRVRELCVKTNEKRIQPFTGVDGDFIRV